MKKAGLLIVLAMILVGAAVPSAFASVIIDFTGIPANSENGTYNGFVSGAIAGIPFSNLICDDYHPRTYFPSSGAYRVSTLDSLTYARFVAAPGSPTSAEILNYETAAILIDNMMHHMGETAQYQYALWHLFSPDVEAYGNSASLLLTAQTQAQNIAVDHSILYSELLIYTPVPGQSGQEFLQLDPPAMVPEPSVMILIGTGLVLIGALTRRRRSQE